MDAMPTEARAGERLPSSIPRVTRGEVLRKGLLWVQTYCCNCACEGPMAVKGSFAHWMCVPCHEKYGAAADGLFVADEVYFERVKQAQLEQFGRELTHVEILQQLDDPDSQLSKLAKDNPFTTGNW